MVKNSSKFYIVKYGSEMDKRDKEKFKKRGCNIVQDVVLYHRGREITNEKNGGKKDGTGY